MLTIASYNIRKSVGLDWKRNPARIHKVIAELDADIVLLQEVDKRFGSRDRTLCEDTLLNDLDYHFVQVAERDNSQGWHGNAILYRKPFRLLESHRLNLPTVEPRGAITALFKVDETKVFQIVGTHLSLLKATRQKQIRSIAEQLQASTADYTVIGGDFNEAKAEQWFVNEPILADYQLVTPGFSFHSSKPIRAFDRFIINKNILVKTCSVHNSPLAKRASDHLPVTIQLELSS